MSDEITMSWGKEDEEKLIRAGMDSELITGLKTNLKTEDLDRTAPTLRLADKKDLVELLGDVHVSSSKDFTSDSILKVFTFVEKFAKENNRLRKYQRNARTAIRALQRAYDEKSRLLDRRAVLISEEPTTDLTISMEDLSKALPQVEGRYS